MKVVQPESVFNRHPLPMWIHDRQTFAFLEVNEKLLTVLGYDRFEFLRMKTGDILPQNKPPPLSLNSNPDFPSGHSPALLQIRCKDGSFLQVHVLSVPWEDDNPVAVLVTLLLLRDVSLESRTLEARLRISEFSHSHSLDELLRKTLDESEALTGSTIGFFHFVEEDQKTVFLQNWSTNTLKNMCTADGKLQHYSIDLAGVWVDCIRLARPVIHNDYPNLKIKKGLPPGHAHLSRILTVPIFRGGMIVAVLGVGNKPTDYDENDVLAVNLLADLAWDINLAKRVEETLRASESSYRSVMDQASDGIFIADLSGRYLDVNRAGCEMLGYTREEVLRESMQTLAVNDKSTPLRFAELMEGKTVISEREMIHKDGRRISVEISAKKLDDGRLQGIVRDITERKNEEERVRYLANVMNRISSVVISTDVELRITQWNRAAEELYGWKESEVIGRVIDEVCQTEFQENQRQEAHYDLTHEKRWQGELKQHHRDGRELWIAASNTLLEDERGIYIGNVTINHDITKRKRAEDDLRRAKNAIEEINTALQRAFEREQLASRTDGLTGIFNRRYFFELLDYEFSVSARYQRPMSIVMFDIDHFKQINDTHGHMVGDEVLKLVAETARSQLRDADVLARYGGDEFVILLPNSHAQDAEFVFKRVHKKLLSSNLKMRDQEIPISISVGIANYQPGMETTSQLVQQADQALYAAKNSGRSRIVVSDEED
ncbi:MAG: diguanylate cyclase [Anaerolineales bacterium]|nr:diguanylate cyclase [Anaerolineales bacterium]